MFRHHVKAWLSFDRLQLDLVGDRGEVLLRRRVLLPVRVEVEAADVVLRTNHFDVRFYTKAIMEHIILIVLFWKKWNLGVL